MARIVTSTNITNLVPECQEVLDTVESVRARFVASLKSNEKAANQAYDRLDIEELQKPLPPMGEQDQSLAFRLISRLLNFRQATNVVVAVHADAPSSSSLQQQPQVQPSTQKEIDGAVESLKELLKYRNHFKLSQSVPEQFSKEFYILSGIFPFGHDRQQLPVLYVRPRWHRRWSPKLDETFKRYVAWNINTITKSYHGAKVSKSIGVRGLERDGSFVLCFDCQRVSYSNIDLEFMRFMVRLLMHHYHGYCRYALGVDLPWLFRSVWRLVASWLPEDARNAVHLISSAQLTDYIDPAQIPNSMKFNDSQASEKPVENKHKLPENYESIREIDELGAELQLSANEIKQFKAHAEKARKEYEELGAI